MVEIAVYTVAHKVDGYIDKFLEELKKNTTEPFTFVVSDNSEKGEVTEYLRKQKHSFRIITLRNNRNLGFGIASNQALEQASEIADYMYRVDWDITLSRDWTQKLRESAEKNGEIGLVVPNAPLNGYQIQRDGFIEVDVAIGYCMCIPKRAIEHLDNFYEVPHTIWIMNKQYSNFSGGLHDPNYYYGAEDFDYSLTMRFAGLKIAMVKNVKVIHEERSHKSEWQSQRHKYVWASFDYYRAKWQKLMNFYGRDKEKGWTNMWDCLPMNVAYRVDFFLFIKSLVDASGDIELSKMKNSLDWPAYLEEFARRGIEVDGTNNIKKGA